MEIIQYSNGSEGAKNSSTQNDNSASIEVSDNDSYAQTRLVGAISKSLGYDGLHGPVSQSVDGTQYTFDFYHREDQQLMKVFRGFDAQAYQVYAKHPRKPILIFESQDIPCQMEICECGCGSTLVVAKEMAEQLYDNPNVLIHAEGNLWEYGVHFEGKWIWKKRVPFLIRELMADCENDEFDGDEGDED